eukprot:TRINITY_DN6749_c0_g1_i2.p1 TRINITY_DN6749_c0_g1~~TRINITY_DN6749_c0_g1_i2.p1  ORF type:complete len:917 (+),score=174.86 TRINITY_DN6749_c0_g1_i2:99-2849(+)
MPTYSKVDAAGNGRLRSSSSGVQAFREFNGNETTFAQWRNGFAPGRALTFIDLFADEKHRDEGYSKQEGIEEEEEEEPQKESDEESSSSEGMVEKHLGGLAASAPRLYDWLVPRVGSTQRFLIIITLLILEGIHSRQEEYAGDGVNRTSIACVTCLLSLIIGLIVSFTLEGTQAFAMIFGAFRGWSIIACCFAIAKLLDIYAISTGVDHVFLLVIDNFYVPIAAVISFFAFSRVYGKLEWLALAMIVLSSQAFLILRDRCDRNYCHKFAFSLGQRETNPFGIILSFLSVVVGVIASVAAERLFKGLSPMRVQLSKHTSDAYYIDRVHLDFFSALVLLAVACLQKAYDPAANGASSLFGTWTKRHYFMVIVGVGQIWCAGLVAKHFSTVTKSLAQSIAVILATIIVDPYAGMTFGHNWGIRAIPSLMILVIVILSVVIFQTGRLDLRYMQVHHGIEPKYELGGLSSVRAFFCGKSKDTDADGKDTSAAKSSLVEKMTLPVLYILANSMMTELQNVVSANRFFVPQSLQVMIPFCAMIYSTWEVWSSKGFSGVKEAFDPKTLPKFIGVGFLTSLTGALAGMAMGLGISASLYVAVGKIYTPEALILGRLILNKKYLWIEWLTVAVLFDSSVTLAMLGTAIPSAGGRTTNPAAILCVAGSATSACVMSIVTEIVFKAYDTPFPVKNIRLQLGAFIWGIVFLPIMGISGMWGGRPDLAFWNFRAADFNAVEPFWYCKDLGSCDQASGSSLLGWLYDTSGTFVLNDPNSATGSGCICGRGIFLGWNGWIVYVTLAVGVFNGYMTGKVLQNLGTDMRSVLDGFPIALLTFLISPLSSKIPFSGVFPHSFWAPFRNKYNKALPFFSPDVAKDFITLVNPLSAISYVVAAAEVRKVAELKETADKEDLKPMKIELAEPSESETE